MPQQEVHQCQCPDCLGPEPHPDQEIHRQMNLLLSRLDEQQRRWYAAVEIRQARPRRRPARLPHHRACTSIPSAGGGRNWPASLEDRPADRVRLPGGGRPALEKKSPRSSRPC